MLIDDEWSGLADLLANLIAKYASELSIDDMPTPNYKKDYSNNEKKRDRFSFGRCESFSVNT